MLLKQIFLCLSMTHEPLYQHGRLAGQSDGEENPFDVDFLKKRA